MTGFPLMRKGVASLACWWMLAGAPGVAARGPARESSLQQARTAMRQGDASRALSLLRPWVAAHPGDVTSRLMLGDAFRAARQPQQAEAEFKTVLKLSPGNFAALLELGSLYVETDRLEQAEPLLARASRERPLSPVARMEWAMVLARLHEYAKAAAALRGVSGPTDPGQRIAWERLKASIENGLGKTTAAAADMERALKIAPNDPELQLATGIVQARAGHPSRAIELLGPIFREAPNLQAGLPLLGATLTAHRDGSSTLKAIRTLAQGSKDELAVRLSVARVLARHGLFGEAAKDFERAADLDPGQADLLYNLALARYRAGDLEGALQSARQAKSVQNSASIESLLGEIEEAKGDSLAAVRSMQAAVAMAPGSEAYRLSLGLEFLRHETFKPALAVFQEGAKLFPESLRMRVALGLAYYFLEEYPRSIQTLAEAARLGKDAPLPLEYLGRIQLQQIVTPDTAAVKQLCGYADAHPQSGTLQAYCGALRIRMARDQGHPPPPAALSRLRQAARLGPKDPTARCELGKALDWAHQWSEARGQLEACVRLDPNSVDAHYLLAGIYRRLGLRDLAAREIKLHDQAVRNMVQSNARRDRTLEKFLFTMHSRPSDSAPPAD
jgi:tetratricopeptide (TPR) repeat protein